jgi:TatD DNase family protein
MKMGTVMAVCIQEVGTSGCRSIGQANVAEDFGLSGDCRSGKNKRQVSILPFEWLQQTQGDEKSSKYGRYGENLVVKDIDLASAKPGDKLICNDIILQVQTKSPAAVHSDGQNCVFKKYGLFCRVLMGGIVTEGDQITLERKTITGG